MLINSPNISGSLKVTGNTVITGSLTVLGGINATITGSATTASYVEYSNVANKPTLVSGSAQVSFNGITDKPTLVSGSAQVSYPSLSNIPSGIVSGSSQISFNGIVDKPTLVSGSSQITYSGLSGIPNGIVSGSAQVVGLGFATTGSNTFIGSQTITGSIFGTGNLTINGCITATGQIVAQTINVQQVTSSIVYSCGSNVFGTDISNTQQFTGSMLATGSLRLTGPMIGSSTACFGGNITTSGCVGIGTPTAATPLHIVTAGLPTIRLTLGSEARCHNINGVNLGRDLQVLPFRHFSVQTGNGIAEGQIVLNAYEDFIVGTGASYTSRLTITPTGIACFSCQVCAPNLLISNCATIGTVGFSYPEFRLAVTPIMTVVGAGCSPTSEGIYFKRFSNLCQGGWISGNGGALYIIGQNKHSSAFGDIYFASNNGTATCDIMIIDGVNQRVGIGTTTPYAKFEVLGGNQCPPSTGTQNYTMALRDPTSMVCGVGGSILFQGYKTGTAAIGNFAYIAGKKENGTAGNEAGYLSIGAFDSAGNISESMRVSSAGNVGIGNSSPSYKLHVSSTTPFGYSGGGVTKQHLINSKTAASSGTALKLFYVGFSHVVRLYLYITQDSSNLATAVADFTTAYGASSGGVTYTSRLGNISSISAVYNNGGSPAYTIDVTVNYTGTAPTIYAAIEGISNDAMYKVD